jgi:1-deoxy-D-xylulose-5-phosphate reductoisomerase
MLGLRVLAVSADKNIKLLEEQTRKFRPAVAAVFDSKAALDFRARIRDLDVRVFSGMDGLIEAARAAGADTVVTAVVGTIGLLPTLEAIDLGKRIALANKETLVCAGEPVMKRARERGCEIIPVDSEHSALFQCLQCLHEQAHGSVKSLTLTASGGPFRGMGRDELRSVTPEMALKHPNWDMGKKVSIDSATMMNKGLEVIEAVHLFSMPPDKIDVVVHPESIVHSMVEFTDNSAIAQLSLPDMRLPIQYALTYPQRTRSLTGKLDITQLGALTFEKPDLEAFPCLALALETSAIRGTACAVLNAANEAAVGMFLNGNIGFYEIYESVLAAVDNITNIEDPTLEDIIEADGEAKRFVNERFKG